jgi:SAM-dependent methyltransferase
MATTGVRPDDRVLDVGCGLGRITWPLSRLLDARGEYVGFDTSSEYIDWCRSTLPLDAERFRFHHFSIHNSHYNEHGSVAAETFTFPWPNDSFTLAIAASLFTHLTAQATTNYFREIARTLRPGGRLFASVFALDEQSRDLAIQQTSHPRFDAFLDEGMIGDPSNPDAAVAFHAEWLAAQLATAGLAFDAFYPGRWRHIAAIFHQDILIAHKD